MTPVVLTTEEWTKCILLGYEQYQAHRTARSGHLWDDPLKGWNDALAKGAEYAVVKMLGGTLDGWFEGNLIGKTHWDRRNELHDYKDLEIRSTPHPSGRLIVYPKDPDASPFVLVNTWIANKHRIPAFLIIGWLMGEEAKQPEWWWAEARRPGYFISAPNLRPISELT